ncbi:hypothetical protein KDI_47560 [Dictyobacter arantiisoli]|uniref:Uncharacterized protein n=1 Tax=Dictyobacter arantiisoli TaxID=2014874 RepID=A0A5A5TIN8_9CHLR|nr:hypothetical protein KDI_47560 [Dictyobacter arantiisoli]
MKSLNDNESVSPSGLTGMDGENGKGRSGVVGNERLTALAGSVLLVLILVELVSSAYLQALMPIHIFVGVLLAGPSLPDTFFMRFFSSIEARRT